MPYAPTVNDRSGEILGGSINNSLGMLLQGAAGAKQRHDENKTLDAENKALVPSIKAMATQAGMTPEMVEQMVGPNPDLSPKAYNARLKATLSGIGAQVQMESQKQQQAIMQMQMRDAEAKRAQEEKNRALMQSIMNPPAQVPSADAMGEAFRSGAPVPSMIRPAPPGQAEALRAYFGGGGNDPRDVQGIAMLGELEGAGRSWKPEVVNLGDGVKALMTSPKSATQIDLKEAAGPSSPMGKLLQDLKGARDRGDTEQAELLLASAKKDATPSGMALTVGPDGSVQLVQGPNGLTTGTAGRSQEAQFQSERVVREGAQLLQRLRAEDVGAMGVVKENFVNKGLAQINPAMADEVAQANRTSLRAFREGALKQVSGDARFSNADRTAIEKMLPSDGVFESLPSAQAKILAVLHIMQGRAGAEAGRRGETSIVDQPPEKLVEAAKAGKIDPQVAAALLNALHPEYVDKATGKAAK